MSSTGKHLGTARGWAPLWRRAAAGVAVLALALVGLVLPQAWRASAAPDENSNDLRTLYSTQDRGYIQITGNTLTSCADSDACRKVRDRVDKGGKNNDYLPAYVDADGDPQTFDSSSAHITVPTGAKVLKAYLFWGSSVGRGKKGNVAQYDIGTVKFKAPGQAAYSTVSNDPTAKPTSARYQLETARGRAFRRRSFPKMAWADVTDAVSAAGSGDYWVADVPTDLKHDDRYAGWALVLVLQDKTQPLRDLRVFNSYKVVGQGSGPTTVSVKGLITPRTGDPQVKIGTVVYEGDQGFSGDYITVNGHKLADQISPADNFFNSSVSANGSDLRDRNPFYENTMAIDAKVVDATGTLKNGESQATISLNTVGDEYYLSALTTQIDLYRPDVQVVKSLKNLTALARGASPETPGKVGDILEYTLVANNDAAAFARDVVVKDNIPANVEYVADSLRLVNNGSETVVTDDTGDDAGEFANGQVRARVGEGSTASQGGVMEPHGSRTVKFKVKVLGEAAGEQVSNTAGVTYTSENEPGKEFGNPSNEVVRPFAPKADVGIVKRGPAQVGVGAQIEWTLDVTNHGPTAAKDVRVSDPQPEGVTGLQLSDEVDGCAVADNTLTCNWASLENGQTRSVKLRATASGDGSAKQTVTNVATVTTSSSDGNPDNDMTTVRTEVKPAADLSITKQADPSSVTPGETLNWKLVVTNNGPAPSERVQLSDTLPAGLTVAADPTSTAGTCSHTQDSVSCELGTIASGDTVTVTVPALLAASWTSTDQIENQASVSSPATDDPNPDNNTARANVTPLPPRTDVSIVKTASAETAVPGQELTYTLAVAAAGPSVAANVHVSDELPADLSFVSATVPGGQCENSGRTVTCKLGDLPAGAKRAITVHANVAAGAEGDLSNTATVGTDTPDSNPGNDRSTVTTGLTPLADLVITKTSSAPSVVAGKQVTYTLAVENRGPSTSRALRVSDRLPDTLEPVSVSSAAAECTRAGATFTCTKETLENGQGFTVTVVARVPANARVGEDTQITNTARVEAKTKDPDPDNNEASHKLTPEASADLQVTKTAGAEEFVPGKQASWSIEVRNLGPSDAHGIRLADQLPAQLVADTVSATAGGGASCTVTEGVLKCTADTLAAAGSFTVKLAGTVAASADGENIANTATVESDTPESSTDNNSSTVTTPLAPRADLAVTKTAPQTVAAGEDISWQIRVTNNGPAVAKPVTVVDPLPAHVSNVRVADDACQISEQGSEVTCTLPTLAPGATHSFKVVGTTAAGLAEATEISNTASANSPVADPNPDNNSGTAKTNVVPSAQLAVTKTASVERFTAGETASYTIAVTNSGPSTARNVRISDPMPAGLTALSATGPGECTIENNRVSCTIAALAANSQAPASFKVNVRVGAAVSDDVTNVVEVSSDTPNPDGDVPRAETTTPVGSSADVVLTKTAKPTEVVAGGALTWTLTATNRGPSAAKHVVVTDTLPAGVSLVSPPDGCEYDAASRALSCDAGDLAVGEAAGFALPVTVAADIAAGTLTNTAHADSDTPDPDESNNTPTSSVTVTQNSQLTLTKDAQVEQATPGQRIEWLVKVSNAGPSTARGVKITDALPEGLSNVTAAVVEGKKCAVAGRNITCGLDTLAVGERIVRVTADLAPGYTDKQVVNTAQVTTESPSNASGGTPLKANSTVPVVPSADLALAKTVGSASADGTVAAGQRVRYVLAVTNKGPSLASNAAITDVLPAQLSDYQIDEANQGECELLPASVGGNSGEEEDSAASGPTLSCTHAQPLEVGQQWRVVLTAAVPANGAGTKIVNSANVGWPGEDPNPRNDGSTASFTPGRSVDLGVTKSADRKTAKPGQNVVWTVVISNNGSSDAVNLKLADTIDKRLETGSIAAPEGVKCKVEDAQLACAVAELKAGASATLKYTTKVRFGAALGELPNVAELTDPDTGTTVPGRAQVTVVPWPHRVPPTTSPTPPAGGVPATPPAGTPSGNPTVPPSATTPTPATTHPGTKADTGTKKPAKPGSERGVLAVTGARAVPALLVLALLAFAGLTLLGAAQYKKRS